MDYLRKLLLTIFFNGKVAVQYGLRKTGSGLRGGAVDYILAVSNSQNGCHVISSGNFYLLR